MLVCLGEIAEVHSLAGSGFPVKYVADAQAVDSQMLCCIHNGHKDFACINAQHRLIIVGSVGSVCLDSGFVVQLQSCHNNVLLFWH